MLWFCSTTIDLYKRGQWELYTCLQNTTKPISTTSLCSICLWYCDPNQLNEITLSSNEVVEIDFLKCTVLIHSMYRRKVAKATHIFSKKQFLQNCLNFLINFIDNPEKQFAKKIIFYFIAFFLLFACWNCEIRLN